MLNVDLFFKESKDGDKSITDQIKRDLNSVESSQGDPLEISQPKVKLVRYDPENPSEYEGYFDNSNHVVAKIKR